MSAFAKWIDTFVDEKGLDLGHTFTISTPGHVWETHYIPLEVVIDIAKGVSANEQLTIKNTLVRLDVCNQPVLPYFEHLAKALAEAVS
ncbi:hypothetical protein KNU48_gp048 [Mycobacterium phage Silverleaf]|uniref:Uncharacterized protein n=1 Tax=Mycobacterium phage Silverleaf TaxID=2517969 RepID=A0A482J943_9CAUD|nr:hypothetical protein KNU48_gp048 [Mycobacterium phage Silverleaf]QBP29195.1 hypothetical protein SEA_SILVERLEAF_122 [Mycobacterium phage Silverleaf]